MALLTYRNLEISFGGPKLLDDATLSIEQEDRICLVGRNGEGKSTLLRILAGQVTPDHGEIEKIPDLRIAKLDQEISEASNDSVFELVSRGLGAHAECLTRYMHALHELSASPEDKALEAQVDALQHEMDHQNAWSLEHRVKSMIDRVGLDGDAVFNELSGGNKRRALLARALVSEPHILLLDEPTNHLDMPAITWLEDFLARTSVALVFVSHDRAFVRRMATRIFDLDRGQLTIWDCRFDDYLMRKAQWLEAEAQQQAVFDKKLAEEEVWIRKGIQARRTRNEGRVRALLDLRKERAKRRDTQGTAKLEMSESQQSGRKVITAKNISYSWDGKPLIKDFSTTVWRGDKIGVVGLNGSGKTTLLNLLLGKLQPATGEVIHGTKLEVAYFDQHRALLDENLSVAENVSPNGEMVSIGGRKRHIISYLADFLFTPETTRAPITKLSGGERARLLLARLFLQPANVLVLDEPTNDLDIETVELLEERLLEFEGTLLIVSHDRSFLNNVVTSTLALSGNGQVEEFIGGCEEWLAKQTKSATSKPTPSAKVERKKTRKLLNKERNALKKLPELIEKLEAEQVKISSAMSQPDYYEQGKNDPAADAARLEQIETELLEAMEEWDRLETLRAEIEN